MHGPTSIPSQIWWLENIIARPARYWVAIGMGIWGLVFAVGTLDDNEVSADECCRLLIHHHTATFPSLTENP